MIDPVSDRRPPVSPQLALRIAIFGIVAFSLFAVVFFRLWYLQVLSGDQYLAQARSNKVRVERIAAPRGEILDRSNNPIVQNRLAIVVKLRPNTLPDSERQAVAKYGFDVISRAKRAKGKKGNPIAIPVVPVDLRPRLRRLSQTIGMPVAKIQDRIVRGLYLTGYAPVLIRADVGQRALTLISERSEDYPGVEVERAYLREYPFGNLAAQALGTVGEINTKELTDKAYRGIPQGTVIGQDGLESKYDNFLRGTDGTQRFLVDAQGNFKGRGLIVAPKPGQSVRLSLDMGLQRAAARAYANYAGSLSGAFVAMDPRNGEILAMGSFPTYDPADLVKPQTPAQYDALFGGAGGGPGPLFNRAISSDYSTGSTFKLATSLAALSQGLITTTSLVDDTGCIHYGTIGQKACNSGGGHANGSLALPQALKISSDVFFYQQGLRLFPLAHQPLQTWARRLGFGRPTGIDLPGETSGLVPDSAWRKRVAKEEIACRKKRHIPISADVYFAGAHGCGISDMRNYSEGDNLNLAVGQGDLQATPLQLAVAYSALANGGKVVTPRLANEVEDDQGRVQDHLTQPPSRRISIDPNWRSAILEGLREAASSPGGTSADVFANWNHSKFPIFGKTGTAQVLSQVLDQSWYVAYSYDGTPDKKPIVVVATAEKGGFGAHTAAPIVGTILDHWFGQHYPIHAGSNGTR